MTTAFNPWLDLEARRAELQRHGENTSRWAFAAATYQTTGWGEYAFPDVHEFDLTFAERPYVSYGYAVVNNRLTDVDEVLVDTRFPRAWGGICQWQQNSRGFYTGAWAFTVVESASPFIVAQYEEPTYVLQHHFTFMGLGVKDLPDYDLDENPEK